MKASYSELKARFNKFTDSNKKIAELYQLFSNYFINTVEILNTLSLILDNSKLSDTKITDDDDIYITDTINFNLSDAAVNLAIIISLDSSRKTSVKKIMM